MSGTELKNILKDLGYNISEIANLLGYSNSQRLHSALGADDVKTGLVEDLARVLNRNITDFFTGKGTAIQTSAHVTTSKMSSQMEKNYIELIKKKDEQIDRLLSIIEKLGIK